MSKDQAETKTPPKPEVLHPQGETSEEKDAKPSVTTVARHALRRPSYRPSHRATFLGIAAVVAILVVNAGIVAYVMRGGSGSDDSALNRSEVTLSSGALDKLGVSRSPIGNDGAELVVGPDAKFNGDVVVGNNVSIAGELKLNSTFSAADANLTKLQAGDTALQQLNVNGDATASALNLRQDLTVLGQSRLQGPVTMAQLLTVNNSVNIAGNLAVGGLLSARSFQASNLVSDTTLTIGGHIISRGSPPRVSPGGALGSNGTVSISGSDVAGTIGVNMGVGAGNGIVANVTFQRQYGATPRVVVSGGGRGMGAVYVVRNSTGFSIGIDNSVAPGAYTVDYIVMQ